MCWATGYHGRAVDTMRERGRQGDDENLAHMWSTHLVNVHFYSTHIVAIDGELAQLDTDGYRRSGHPEHVATGVRQGPSGRLVGPGCRSRGARNVCVQGRLPLGCDRDELCERVGIVECGRVGDAR